MWPSPADRRDRAAAIQCGMIHLFECLKLACDVVGTAGSAWMGAALVGASWLQAPYGRSADRRAWDESTVTFARSPRPLQVCRSSILQDPGPASLLRPPSTCARVRSGRSIYGLTELFAPAMASCQASVRGQRFGAIRRTECGWLGTVHRHFHLLTLGFACAYVSTTIS